MRDQGSHGGRKPSGRRPGVETSRNGVQGAAPEETRANVGAHRLCRQVTTALFDIRIVNLDKGSYLHMTPDKALLKAEK